MVETNEEDAEIVPAMSHCINGHTVKLQKVEDRDGDVSNKDGGSSLKIRELSVFGTLICRAGLWENSRGSCVPCPADQYSIAGAASCTNCPLGTTANQNRTKCETGRLILILWSLLGVLAFISVILMVALARKHLRRKCTCSFWTLVSNHSAQEIPLEMVPLPAQSAPSAVEPEAPEIIYDVVEPVTTSKSVSSTQESCHSVPATPLEMVPLPAQSAPSAVEPEAQETIYNVVEPVTTSKSVTSVPEDPIYTVPNK